MSNHGASWDHIIIGAGSAGAIVAARLSEDPKRRVLLIEAGGTADQMRFRVPAMSRMRAMGDPGCDWMFMTEPDPSRLDRIDMWSRGKVLGGSSILNGTIYVRGNRGDYDHWAQLGNTGWDYDSMLTYFGRLEHGHELAGDYGNEGPVHITKPKGVPKLAEVFIEAMGELGVPANPRYNGEEQTGASICHLNQHKGMRESTARCYLDPAARRPNLTIYTHSLVRRILFDGRRAAGVEFDHGGKTQIARCLHDIVLSSSAFNTPKLLMLSGIGDPEHLQANGVGVVYANPAVGRNLQEHPAVPVKAYVNTRTTNMDTGLFGQAKIALHWALTRGGAATYIFPALAFVKSHPDLEYPDLQFQFGAFAADATPGGVKWLDRPAVTMLINVNRSMSRGVVKLRSGDPLDPPMIYPNMLIDRDEVALLKLGVKLGRKLWRTKAFAPYFVGEYLPDQAVENDAELEDFVRRTASTSYHSCGTAKMGIDEHAVVDPRLRVIGVTNLRVIDCSIIPHVPSGNINAISMAIGEKGAAMIKEDCTQ